MRKVLLSELPVEIIDCPVCSGASFTRLGVNDRYRMGLTTVGCNQCGLIMTNPQPTMEAMNSFYEKDYRSYYQNTIAPSEDYVRTLHKDKRAQHLVDYLQMHNCVQADARILDVGCAEGAVLKQLRTSYSSLKLEGVEPNPDFATFASGYVDAKIWPVLEDVRDRHYDLIMTNHVLEHINNPVRYLESLGDLLSQKGVLYIGVPDAECYRGLGDLHIAHLYHFTQQTLVALLATAKLRVLHIERHAPPRHPVSIRCLVQKDTAVKSNSRFENYRHGWQLMQRIDRRAWLYRLRRHPFVQSVLSVLKRLHQTGGAKQS